jgi:hypothetical protein
MSKIENVKMGSSKIHPMISATTGVSTCIAVVIVTDLCGVFLSHVSPENFLDTESLVIDSAQYFIETVIEDLFKKSPGSNIKDVYLIGGVNKNKYALLKDAVDTLRALPFIIAKKNVETSQLKSFLSCVKLNMIGCNVQKQRDETSKNKIVNYDDTDDENSDDNRHDYVFDCTLVCDLSSKPPEINVFQYGGEEHEMEDDRSQITPRAIYKIDLYSNNIKVIVHPMASKLVHHEKKTIQ